MDCDDASTEAQDVRIVCHNPDAGCERLFEGGAENTIVRLPEEVCLIFMHADRVPLMHSFVVCRRSFRSSCQRHHLK